MLLGAVSGAAQDTSNFVGQVYSATDRPASTMPM